MDRIYITTYREVRVELESNGSFCATPPNAKKERMANTLHGIQREIDDYLERSLIKRRKTCRRPFRYWNYKAGALHSAVYLGTRGKGSALGAGHLFEDKVTGEDALLRDGLRVFSGDDIEKGTYELEQAAAALSAAQAVFNAALERWTTALSVPYLPWSVNLKVLEDTQCEMLGVFDELCKED
jgi:hypothetical protein